MFKSDWVKLRLKLYMAKIEIAKCVMFKFKLSVDYDPTVMLRFIDFTIEGGL